MPAKVVINVQYCGGWNYTPQFFEAKEFILKHFPENVEVNGAMDSGRPTGNFEIRVNGETVHSKRWQGHEFLVGNPPQEEAVLAAIAAELAK